MKSILSFWILLVFCQTMLGQEGLHTLAVEIYGLEQHQGKVAISLCDVSGKSIREMWIVVEEAEVRFEIDSLSAGDYSIKFFHDANNNGTMDKNWMGIPTEMFGFSNDAPVKLGPPDIGDTLFKVGPDSVMRMRARRI